MPSLADAIARVNRDAASFFDPDLIDADCSAFGHVFRNRRLAPTVLITHFLRQVLAGNAACAAVAQMGEAAFTPAAYCLARQRLPLQVIESLQLRIAGLAPGGGAGRWCGRRTVLLDGTSCSMPDTDELREEFGYPGGQKPGLGFPCAHLLCLFDHATGMVLETIAGPRATNDLEGLPDAVKFMPKESVLVADRAFGSFIALASCREQGADAVLRQRSSILVDFKANRPYDRRRKGGGKGVPKSRWVRSLGEQDQIVVQTKPRMRSRIVTEEEWKELPEAIEVRELRFKVARPGWRTEEITLVTTLLDPVSFPKEKIIELYLARWKVEGNIRDLKQTLKMDILKGKSVDVVKKELAMHTVVYNLVQLVRLEAAKKRQVAADRVSFADALRWLVISRKEEVLGRLVVNPIRDGRFDVRAVKRRSKALDLLTRPRREARAEILAKFAAKQASKQGVAA